MSILTRIFGKTEESAEILCPHCENAMAPDHDVDRCARKRMSRRFFFGTMAGAAVAVALPSVATPELAVGDIITIASVNAINPGGNRYLTINEITFEMLHILHDNMKVASQISAKYDQNFLMRRKIGTPVTVRRPRRFIA